MTDMRIALPMDAYLKDTMIRGVRAILNDEFTRAMADGSSSYHNFRIVGQIGRAHV